MEIETLNGKQKYKNPALIGKHAGYIVVKETHQVAFLATQQKVFIGLHRLWKRAIGNRGAVSVVTLNNANKVNTFD